MTVIEKPKIQKFEYIDFFMFTRWCHQEHDVDVTTLLTDMEATNDSYCYTYLRNLRQGDQYAKDAARILESDFGFTDKVVFWVSW